MNQVIRIPQKLYNRLARHASGFETPVIVIEKLLNHYEKNFSVVDNADITESIQEIAPANSLEIIYFFESEKISEKQFKAELLDTKKAYIKMYYTNDTSEIKKWSASRFTESSKVDGNLRSGFLRGWKERGIFKAELAINRDEIA